MSRSVAILVPARDTVMTSFAYDLARAMSFYTATTDDRVMLYTSHGTLIASQRMELARQALEEKADYLLWLDSDMRFPKETIGHLILRDKPIVAANYATRRMPVKPVAMMDGGGKIDRVYTGPESQGLEPVDYVGMGVMMVKREVFENIEAPWFAIPYSTIGNHYIGEDVFFCRKAKEAGYEVLLDHDLSQHVKHIGTFEYSHEGAWAMKEQVEGGTNHIQRIEV
jgi:hypothetical protein